MGGTSDAIWPRHARISPEKSAWLQSISLPSSTQDARRGCDRHFFDAANFTSPHGVQKRLTTASCFLLGDDLTNFMSHRNFLLGSQERHTSCTLLGSQGGDSSID